MSKADNALDMISDLGSEYYELDDDGKMTLLDNLIDVVEDLHSKDVTEGYYYEEMYSLIQEGEELPKPFSNFEVKSALSEILYTAKVKLITSINWKENGDLFVNFLGTKVRK